MLSKALLKELRSIAGRQDVLTAAGDLVAYSYDATQRQSLPEAVVFVTSTAQVSAVLRAACRHRVAVVPRGAGTNLSGGSLSIRGGIVLELSRMNRILEIDTANRRAVVQPGVINLDLQNTLARLGFMYAPDPASQKTCTLGGNLAEDSGGPHCLKYGVTSNHILGMELVLPDGEVVDIGGATADTPGYDLVGLLVGSEGTLGVATRITVRIMPLPEAYRTLLAAFDTLEDAGQAVSEIVAAGIIPGSLELMDRTVLRAVEESFHAGYPVDAEAALIIELDGLEDSLERQAQRVTEICHSNRVRLVHLAQTAAERDALWQGRRGAFGAVARLRPAYIVEDGTVPRTRLVEMLRRVAQIARNHGLCIGNVAHAGDGNLHPLILFDPADAAERARVEQAGREILAACVELGGTLSGEHGIGLQKQDCMSLMFTPDEINLMRAIKHTLDPNDLMNPGKVLPPL
ncbi:MAG: FAD-binding protein [Chloroflexi bacterium]|nr:FAD-binding protein [Chloroflexota bacterium]